MLFTDRAFFIFFAAAGAAYYALHAVPLTRKAQPLFLIAASFFFYAWEMPQYGPLLALSILLNALVSYFLPGLPSSRAKWLLAAGLILNLLILSMFKYGGLFLRTLAHVPGLSAAGDLPSIALPLGISFYTFQGMSLIVDAYRDPEPPVSRPFWKHLHNTALLMSLFPHQIAGPIVRARLLFPQIRPHSLREVDFPGALRALLVGYFLKLVVADNMRDYTFWLDHPYYEAFSTTVLVAMLIGYSMQIFADFAGYSLIAIGLARLLGYELCQNFDFPYLSASFREFWTRWHMSLSSWLREYLYFPLGGSRVPYWRELLNLIIVMALGGLWHGTAWGFMLWGFVHGLLLVAERTAGRFLSLEGVGWLRPIRIFFVFMCVSIAWSLFRLTDFAHLTGFIHALRANASMTTDFAVVTGVIVYSIPVAGYHIWHALKERHAELVRYEWIILSVMLFFVVTNSGSGARFIYFQF
jgi:alginate O-acetyltransferase complex protein AlgI